MSARSMICLRSAIVALGALILQVLLPLPGSAQSFGTPQPLTNTTRNFQLSRIPSRTAQFAPDGTLHVVYWAGSLATTPSTPSYVYYRTWSATAGWSAETTLDDASVVASQHIGGRHPALALLPSGGVVVSWHDHRHCTGTFNWIDNTEIYATAKAPAGSFGADTRITSTTALHNGDNSYVPRLTVLPDGRAALAWYDLNPGLSLADVYQCVSDTQGAFAAGSPLAANQLTFAATRGGAPAFTMVDCVADSSGTLHYSWMTDFGTGDLYTATRPSVAAALTTPTLLATGAADYFDPPRLHLAPNGDVYLLHADPSAANGGKITLRRKPAGAATFLAPVVLNAKPARQFAPTGVVAPDGTLHLTWLDERNGQPEVYYGRFVASTGALIAEAPIATGATYARPILARRADGGLMLLFEKPAFPNGDLYFATTIAPSAAQDWALYE